MCGVKKYYLLFICFLFIVAGQSCRNDFYAVPIPASVSTATQTLEASKVAIAPNKVTSSYWNTANYLKVTAANISINKLYPDGWLNMTGSFSGLTSFNGGKDPGLTLKAAYDNENIYILVEWQDAKADFSNGSWLYNGPADSKKSDTTGGWTSQRNSDHVALAFEISSASSSSGTFSNVGCAASCHTSAGNSFMFRDQKY